MNATVVDELSKCYQSQEPTLASTWGAVAGRPITDELLEWPPDLFALTDVILERSEAYRFLLSPPAGVEWPSGRLPRWSDAVEDTARQWSAWVDDPRGAVPSLLAEEWTVFRERAGMPLEHLKGGRDWRMCEALLTLHAIADEACAGLGIALDRSDGLPRDPDLFSSANNWITVPQLPFMFALLTKCGHPSWSIRPSLTITY